MNRSLRPVAALSLVAAVAVGVAMMQPEATAQAPVTAPQAAPLVSGLPDFTQLVERVGPAVVNIEAGIKPRRTSMQRQQMPYGDEMPEIFRRFFGPGMPGMPGPNGPRAPGGRGGMSMGTGFIISADGYVLTNHHVVEGSDDVKVKLSDRREFDAKVVGSDPESDVALLKIDAAALPYLRTGDSSLLKPGQWVVAIGSPFGLDHSVTAGIVSAVQRSNPYAGQQYVPFIQTDVAINRGNSGGPLLNTKGEVVGINSQIFSNSGGYMGVSFAIPIDTAMNSVQQLKSTGKVSRGQIGVAIENVDDDAVRGFKLPDARGALVRDVQSGSAGEKAGLRPGDVIRTLDGTAINDAGDLPMKIGAMAPGTRVKLGVFRDGRTVEVPVTLAERSDLAAIAAPDSRPKPATASPSSNPLGIVGQDLDADQRRQLGLKAGEGVAIARIEGLAARGAGLRPGDVVLQVGRDPVDSAAALDRQLRDVKQGETVMLLVRRGQSTQFIAVTPRADGDSDQG
ncbi:serine protease Do [Luteimonas cucumeris]|uniref:Probable periplasmic serine endoprotease DegP-like n=1 Tax=Luteimonas cucumeris TaxID=985012 RepID=A0A562L772_9GAMM|nr:serine protease Do [Luteimonas cucumeris]